MHHLTVYEDYEFHPSNLIMYRFVPLYFFWSTCISVFCNFKALILRLNYVLWLTVPFLRRMSEYNTEDGLSDISTIGKPNIDHIDNALADLENLNLQVCVMFVSAGYISRVSMS